MSKALAKKNLAWLLMSTRELVLERFDEKYTLSLLQRLVQIPSAFPQYEEIASFVKEELEKLGLDVRVSGDSGKDWKRPNVIGTYKGQGKGRTLILTAHTDVVPPYDLSLWKVEPFAGKIIDGQIYGRGTADTKGSLAAMISAARSLVNADLELEGNLMVVAWAGDEYTPKDAKYFDGMSYLAMNDLVKGQMAVFGEPYDLRVTYISRGRIWIDFEVGGEASHSATGRGINAILKSIKLIESVYQLQLGEHPVTGKDTINVGTIHGGTQTNIVPDSCNFTFDIRFGEHLTTSKIEEMIRSRIKEIQESDPQFVLRSMKIPERREPFGFPKDSALNSALIKAGQEIGVSLQYGGAVSFGPVADWKDRVGLTEGCLFGPGKTGEAHAINEHINVNDLYSAAKILSLAIPYTCGLH